MLNETGEVPEGGLHAAAGRGQRRAPGQGRDHPQLRPAAAARGAHRGRALVKDHGIDVELIDLRTLRPLDTKTIIESIKKTNRCVIVDEDWGYCGMGGGIL